MFKKKINNNLFIYEKTKKKICRKILFRPSSRDHRVNIHLCLVVFIVVSFYSLVRVRATDRQVPFSDHSQNGRATNQLFLSYFCVFLSVFLFLCFCFSSPFFIAIPDIFNLLKKFKNEILSKIPGVFSNYKCPNSLMYFFHCLMHPFNKLFR